MKRRATILVDTGSDEQLKGMEAWLAKWSWRMAFVNETDCDPRGTCQYDAEGPEEAFADLPDGVTALYRGTSL